MPMQLNFTYVMLFKIHVLAFKDQEIQDVKRTTNRLKNPG